jgi:phage terminase large subunit GpA-like protein
VLLGEKPLEADDLARLREKGWKLGTVPPGPVVITLSVDGQADRFECTAIGWADGMESWVIDRWSIDVLEDGVTQLEPFRQPEHWRVLLPLFDKTWPLAGQKGARSPKPLAVAIDTGGGGEKNVATATENAKKFWHLAIAAGVPKSRIMLLKGSSNYEAPLVRPARRDDRKLRGTAIRNSPDLWLVNSNAAKFIVDARLRRTSPGPGYVHMPADMEDRHLAELTAEQLNKKGKWEKVRPRNETLDLVLYAWFALIKPPFAKSRSTMKWVPHDFRIRWPEKAAPEPVTQDDDGSLEPLIVPPAAMKAKPVRATRRPGKKGWMGRFR